MDGALDRLIGEHQADVRRMVGRLTAWGNDVDDLTQEVFLKAWKSARSFDGRGALRSWLLAIAVRQCRNHHRATTRLLNALTRLAQRTPSPLTAVGTTENEVVMDERWLEVQGALARLSSRDRELLVLLVMEQQAAEEVAKMLGITTNTLYVRLHRAKIRLTRLLQHKSTTGK